MKKLFTPLLFMLALFFTHNLYARDPLLKILEKELNREFSELKKQEIPVYYMNYRVSDIESVVISGTHGCLNQKQQRSNRVLTTMVRVGTPDMDNFHAARGTGGIYALAGTSEIPLDDQYEGIVQLLWQSTHNAYQYAVQRMGLIKGRNAMNVEAEDKSPDFTAEKPVEYEEPRQENAISKETEELLTSRVKKFSAPFYNNVFITESSVNYTLQSVRRYFVSSEGTKIAENRNSIELTIHCRGIASDGMDLPLYRSYYARDVKDLPSEEIIMAEVRSMVEQIIALRKAPVVEAYAGPALLSGSATGVFFHEIFGHRVESSRMKTVDDSQTFKN